jgi:hypothetical protein
MPIAKSGFYTLFTMMALLYTSVVAQRQIVLVSGNEVVHRFRVGDKFHTKLEGDRNERWGFLVQINEFSVTTSQDTIDLRDIEKCLLPGRPIINRLGKKLVTAGIGLFVIDQFNQAVIQGNDMSIDSGVAKASIVITAAGIPMLFIKKRWVKPGKGVKLVSVGRDSILYKPDL